MQTRVALVKKVAGVMILSLFSVAAYAGTVIRGSVSALTQTAEDNGPVSANMTLPQVRVYYAPFQAQQLALQQLLAEQRTPSSPNYHKWLTPEQFGEKFGISASDEAKVRSWLISQGFANVALSNSRTAFSFSATAAQAQTAFRTQIHAMTVRGESHFANVTEITVPSSLASVIGNVRGLDDIKPHAAPKKLTPQFTWGNGNYELAPGDIATIYNIQPLYAAGINGSGVTVAVVGQSDISMTDITAYRNGFNLPNNTPTVVLVPGSPDPGTSIADETEADIDLELVGAVAPNASLIYVNSTNALNSLEYAIEQNIAQVVNVSYVGCEATDTLSNQQALAYYIAEANSQGMTIVAASGDTGAAGCDSASSTAARNGLSVTTPANQPGVTGVGGTSFSGPLSSYFSSSNGSTGGSALSYIPEIAWNLTSSQNHLEASGGGASLYFAKPGWQQGNGVPTDGQRDVPDVAFFAGDSALNDSTAYVVCALGDCASGTPNMTTSGGAVGGTSAATPVFAGVVALLNHYLLSSNAISKPGLGNINPTLYLTAENTSNVFHSITQGDNIVPCVTGTNNCTTGSFGYSAGAGYDKVTGLGSVDVFNLVHAWSAYTVTATSTALTTSETPIIYGTPITLTASVVPVSGSVTPTGNVVFYAYSGQITTRVVLGTAQLDGTGSATLTLSNGLAQSVSSLQAVYSGSAQFAESLSAAISVYQPTTTTLSASATQLVQGSTVTLSASVSGITASTTGTVAFYDGSTLLGSAQVSSGSASLAINTLPAGVNSLTAVYSGSTYYASSTSAAITVTVSVVAVSTTTSLTASVAQASLGTPITLSASVVAASGSAAGVVNFYNGTTQLGSASLSNGAASLSVSTLPVGTDWITATYVGAAGFASSTSTAVSVTILQPSFTLASTPSTLSVTGGTAATTTVTVTPVNGFNSALTFTCTGLPTGSSCTFGTPASQSNGTSTVSLSISTKALAASVARASSTSVPALALLPLAGILALMKRRKLFASAIQLGIAVVALFAITMGAVGCGGGSSAPPTTTPTKPTPVTSTVTISATAASGEIEKTQLTLTVN